MLEPSVERSQVVLGLVQDTGRIGRESVGRGGEGRGKRVNGGRKLGDDGLLGRKLLDLGHKQREFLPDLFHFFLDSLLLGGRRGSEVVAGRGLVAERKRRTGVELLALVGRDLGRDGLWLELTRSLGVGEGARRSVLPGGGLAFFDNLTSLEFRLGFRLVLSLVQRNLGCPDDTLDALGKVEWRILGGLLDLVLGLASELLQPGLGIVGPVLDRLLELLGLFVDLLRRGVLPDDLVLGLLRPVLYLANLPLDLFSPRLRSGACDGLPSADDLACQVVPPVVVCVVCHSVAAWDVLGEDVTVRVRLCADVA